MRIIPTLTFSGKAIKLLIAIGLPAVAGAQGFRYWNPLDTNHVVPATLSATGLYTDILAKKRLLIPNAHYFDVNSPLWSDDAKKKRWVLLKPGSAPIKYVERDDYWEYPDSAVFIKEFLIDTIAGDTNSRVSWETRILLLKKELIDSAKNLYSDTWFGYSYKWNKDQKDAVLVPIRGQNDSIRVYPQGRTMPSAMKKWAFPSRDQCISCHRTGYSFNSADQMVHGRSVLGFFTAQLNRPHADSAHLNQIEYFFRRNVFTGTKPNYAVAPKWYGVNDPAGTDDQKARAYIAANCSGCHGARGIETGATEGVSLDYDYHTLQEQIEFRHRITKWGYTLDDFEPFYYAKTGDGNNPYMQDSLPIISRLVIPGYPGKSVILFRQMQRNDAPYSGSEEDFYPANYQMPPYAVFQVDTAAINLMTRWIRNMPRIPPPEVNSVSKPGRMPLKGPAIQGRVLVIPAGLSESGRARVTMAAITGRTVELARISRTTFAIPPHMPPGVYILKVGKKSFTRHLF